MRAEHSRLQRFAPPSVFVGSELVVLLAIEPVSAAGSRSRAARGPELLASRAVL
jgi:hypothetical protein